VDPKSGRVSEPVSPETKAKHPVVVSNSKDQILFAWTEGTGWAKGGVLSWQVYDAAGTALADKQTIDGTPAWSLPTAVARPDGSFVIIY
jgi:hypothetical protein